MKNLYLNQSISSATLKSEDLLSAFLPVLLELDTEKKFDKVIQEGYDFLVKLKNGEDIEDEDVSMYINEDLFDAMNNFAPSGYYFGSHPGDGADFGFWQQDDEEMEDLDNSVRAASTLSPAALAMAAQNTMEMEDE